MIDEHRRGGEHTDELQLRVGATFRQLVEDGLGAEVQEGGMMFFGGQSRLTAPGRLADKCFRCLRLPVQQLVQFPSFHGGNLDHPVNQSRMRKHDGRLSAAGWHFLRGLGKDLPQVGEIIRQRGVFLCDHAASLPNRGNLEFAV